MTWKGFLFLRKHKHELNVGVISEAFCAKIKLALNASRQETWRSFLNDTHQFDDFENRWAEIARFAEIAATQRWL